MIDLTHQFLTKDRARQLEQARQARWFIKAKESREKRQELTEEADEALMAFAADAMVASEIRLKEFEARMDAMELKLDQYDAKLDIYDEAVTRALMEQLDRLNILEAQKEAMLRTAFVLEDGRKVFTSEDGSYAVMENGQRLPDGDFHSFPIPKTEHTAEQYLDHLDTMASTKKEIELLHKAQADIDTGREQSAQARELVEGGRGLASKEGVTANELDELEEELDQAMPKTLPNIPTSAMKFVSGTEPTSSPSAKNSFDAAAVTPTDISQALNINQPTIIELNRWKRDPACIPLSGALDRLKRPT